MALSCFPKISPKLIIIQPGNGNGWQGVDQGYPGQTALAEQRLRRDVGVCWVKNFVSFNTYTNPRAKPFNGSQKLTNHISTRTRLQGDGGEYAPYVGVEWDGAA